MIPYWTSLFNRHLCGSHQSGLSNDRKGLPTGVHSHSLLLKRCVLTTSVSLRNLKHWHAGCNAVGGKILSSRCRGKDSTEAGMSNSPQRHLLFLYVLFPLHPQSSYRCRSQTEHSIECDFCLWSCARNWQVRSKMAT